MGILSQQQLKEVNKPNSQLQDAIKEWQTNPNLKPIWAELIKNPAMLGFITTATATATVATESSTASATSAALTAILNQGIRNYGGSAIAESVAAGAPGAGQIALGSGALGSSGGASAAAGASELGEAVLTLMQGAAANVGEFVAEASASEAAVLEATLGASEAAAVAAVVTPIALALGIVAVPLAAGAGDPSNAPMGGSFFGQHPPTDPIVTNDPKSSSLIPKVSSIPSVPTTTPTATNQPFTPNFTPTPPLIPQNNNVPARRISPTSIVAPVPYAPPSTPPLSNHTPPGSTHSINEASTNKNYGWLLHQPVTNNITLPSIEPSTVNGNKIKPLMESQAKHVSQWVNNINPNNPIEKTSAVSKSIVFTPTVTPATTGSPGTFTFNPEFGFTNITKSINNEFRAKNATNIPPITAVPKTVTPSKTPWEWVVPSLLGAATLAVTIPKIIPSLGGAVGNIAATAGNIFNLAKQILRNVEKIKKYLPIQTALNVISVALELHNAALLSTQVIQSCLDVIQNILAAFGLKDLDGNPLEISKLIGESIETLTKKVLGEKTYTDIQAKWKRYSAVYTAASNLLSSFTSIAYGTMSVLQITGQYVASIGNALKRSGQVFDDSYEWMHEGLTGKVSRFTKLTEKIAGATQFAQDIDTVSQSALQVKQTTDEIGTQVDELKKSIKEATGKEDKKDAEDHKASTPPITLTSEQLAGIVLPKD